jgi:four helix bundle protein
MREINSHRDLLVWQQAMDLAAAVYEVSRSWPKAETYGLTSQARRAAVSVCANIAEGYGRENRGSYLHFLRIAQGSLKEVETHLEIVARIGIESQERIAGPLEQSESIGKLLRLLVRRLEQD